MALEDPDFFYQMQDTILKGSSDFFDYGVKLLETVEPIFAICFGIYLLLWVLNYWANPSFTSMGIDFVKKCIAWSIVIALAFNAGNYKKLADTTFNFSNELVEKVISTNNSTVTVNGKKLHEMDNMKNKVYDAVMTAYDKGDEAYSGLKNSGKHLSFNIGIFLTHAILMVVIAIAFTLLLIAKVCLLLVIMVAPFFIGCLLFESTRTWGMNWINTVFGFVLNIFFYAAVIALLIKVVDNQVVKTIHDSLTSDDKTVLLKNALGLPMIVLLAAIVCIITLNRIPQIATALTGGQIGGGSGSLGAAVGGIASAGAMKAGRGAVGGAVGTGKAAAKGGWAALKFVGRKIRGGNNVSNGGS